MMSPSSNAARAAAALAAAVLAANLAMAQQIDPTEGLEPFRHPTGDIRVPEEVFRDLTIMQRLAESGRNPVHFDPETGREICDHPAWREAFARVEARLAERNTATMMHLVLRDSSFQAHRRLAAYATFQLPNPEHVFTIMSLFPADPDRQLRDKSFERSVQFMRVHLPEDQPQTDERREAGLPPLPRYRFVAYPFLKLLEIGDDRDRAKSLWLLKEVMILRPDFGATLLGAARPMLDKLVLSADREVRANAWEFVHLCDPARRPKPKPATEDSVVRVWLDAILYDVFPPIRTVSEGRTDLYPSEDLDRIVAVGKRELGNDAMGETFSGRQRDGRYYRGFRVTRLPEPLDKLRIPLDSVILNVNGTPVTSASELIDVVGKWAEHRRTLMVEYLDRRGKNRVMEYRLQSKPY